MKNKKGQEIGFLLVIIILILFIIGMTFGWIQIGKISTTPKEEDLPQTEEEQSDTQDEVSNFQKCTTASDCNWDKSKYYNRECGGEWRCMESPYPDTKLCSYGCPGNQYCGDGICGGNFENEWTCIDCNKDVGFIGKLEI